MMCGLTGTPGTGKSAVAGELVLRGHTVIHLVDTVGPYISGKDKGRDTQVFDSARWERDFVPVDGFVEGHFAHLLPCDRVVVLRCRPDELKRRLVNRNYPREKIRENMEAEALDVCLIETVERHDPTRILELDTTSHDPAYCADRIEKFVKNEIQPSFGTIDWSAFVGVKM